MTMLQSQPHVTLEIAVVMRNKYSFRVVLRTAACQLGLEPERVLFQAKRRDVAVAWAEGRVSITREPLQLT